jgi:hypothetical protein
MRHDKVGAYLHYSICKALGIERINKWHTHTPVREHGDVTVLCGIKGCTQTEKLQQMGQI